MDNLWFQLIGETKVKNLGYSDQTTLDLSKNTTLALLPCYTGFLVKSAIRLLYLYNNIATITEKIGH